MGFGGFRVSKFLSLTAFGPYGAQGFWQALGIHGVSGALRHGSLRLLSKPSTPLQALYTLLYLIFTLKRLNPKPRLLHGFRRFRAFRASFVVLVATKSQGLGISGFNRAEFGY